MNHKLYKFVKIGSGLLGVIGVILLVLVLLAGDEAVRTDLATQSRVVDPFITFTFVILGIALILTLGFTLLGLLKNPGALKKSLLTLAVLGVLFFIAYMLSNGDAVTDKFNQVIKDGEAGPVSRRVGTLINYTYILGVIGLVCVLWGSLKGMFSK
jgi:hypothetical protein